MCATPLKLSCSVSPKTGVPTCEGAVQALTYCFQPGLSNLSSSVCFIFKHNGLFSNLCYTLTEDRTQHQCFIYQLSLAVLSSSSLKSYDRPSEPSKAYIITGVQKRNTKLQRSLNVKIKTQKFFFLIEHCCFTFRHRVLVLKSWRT